MLPGNNAPLRLVVIAVCVGGDNQTLATNPTKHSNQTLATNPTKHSNQPNQTQQPTLATNPTKSSDPLSPIQSPAMATSLFLPA
jgi:hypothetical protein